MRPIPCRYVIIEWSLGLQAGIFPGLTSGDIPWAYKRGYSLGLQAGIFLGLQAGIFSGFTSGRYSMDSLEGVNPGFISRRYSLDLRLKLIQIIKSNSCHNKNYFSYLLLTSIG